MKRKTIFLIASLLLGLLLFGQSLLQTGLPTIISTFKQLSVLHFLFFLAISTINFYLYSLRWELILKALHPEKKLSSLNLFLHRMAGFSLSYITPSALVGGEPIRIMFLAEDGIRGRSAASSVIIDKAFELASIIIFIVIGIIIALLDGTVPFGGKAGLWATVAILLSLVIWFFYTSFKNIGFVSSFFNFFHLRKFKKLQKIETQIIEFEREMNIFYRDHRPVMVHLTIISVFTLFFILIEHFLVASFLGVQLTFFQAFLTSTVPYLAFLFPVPGGLGVLESGHTTVFAALGVPINALVFVLIIRLRDLTFVALGLAHASKNGLKILKQEYRDDYSPK